MQKIALITDSACDLDLNTLKENNINLLPLRIIYSNGDYRDRIDISPQEVYDNLEKEVPKTSLPSAQETEEILNKLEEEGYTHVICISISSGLSGSFNALRLALEDHPKLTSFVYDSKILAYPQGEIVLEVAKLIKEGKSYEEIVREIPEIRKRVIGYFTINTLEYLKRGGRIGRLAGTVGELLNLKPIITTDEDGVYYNVAKVRGRKQSLSKMTELLKGYLAKGKCEVAVLHAGCEDEAIKYMNSLKDLTNVVSIKIAEISPALGIHGGPGLIGFSVKMVK
ncbi:MAG: DegV family protein [Clostridium sp.]|nr:DegV family protein [Clostridium sp.]